MHTHTTRSSLTLTLLASLAGCSMAGVPGDEAGDEAGATTTGTGEPGTTGPTTATTAPTSATSPTSPTTATTDPTTGDPSATTDPSTGDGPACGDGQQDPGEQCDGLDLGGKQCSDLDAAFIGGALACAGDCGSFDTSGCTLDPSAPLVALNELTSKGAEDGEYAGKGDLIELHNAGGAAADLSGWQLSDDPELPADKTYVFPPGSTLAPGAFLVLVAYDEASMTGDFPFGLSNDKPETLTLADAGGVPRDVLMFDGAAAVTSYCRLPDGTGAWQTCAPSFGAANVGLPDDTCGDGQINGDEDCDGRELGGQTCAGLGFAGGALACGPACSFDVSQCVSEAVVINELESVIDDIEIYNAGNQAIDLSGWILTDDLVDQDYDPQADAEKLVFPAQTSLAAKQFLVVKKGDGPGQHIFGLGGSGDTVTLLRPNLELVDQVAYGPDEALQSYCRLPDGPGGAWTVDCAPTMGASNKAP